MMTLASMGNATLALVVPAVLACAAPAHAQEKGAGKGLDFVAFFDKLSWSYSKINANSYSTDFKGKNLKEITVVVTQVPDSDFVMVHVWLADRKDLKNLEKLTVKLAELNEEYDYMKFALGSTTVYARIDLRRSWMDPELAQLKDMIEAAAAAVDESYPKIRSFLPPAK